MKHLILIIVILSGQNILFAQTKSDNISFTNAEFRAGYGVSIFGNGLKERYEAGNFSSTGGGLFTLAAFHKFKPINNLLFGIKFKALGAGPSKGDYEQEMFFNYWGSAVSVKYFPFDRDAQKGIYLQGDYFFISQFTQKYRNKINKNFDHQFAIGNGLALGLGYDFPIGRGNTMLTIGVEYETNSRKGEVTGLGDKNFRNSNFGIMTGIKF